VEPEPFIYRTEVMGIMEALSDLVFHVTAIHELLEDEEEEED
jgi:hypothetical protein